MTNHKHTHHDNVDTKSSSRRSGRQDIILAPEEELIRQIQKGRQECLDELIELYYPAILRYCLWHMPDTESAQDATQETFLRLIRFIGRYKHSGQFKAYLYQIAANTCIDVRRRLPRTEPLTEELSCLICQPESGYQAVENRQLLATVFTKLQGDQQELLLLRYGQELTLREIAVITGLPLRTVQTKLSRAVKKMRKLLDR